MLLNALDEKRPRENAWTEWMISPHFYLIGGYTRYIDPKILYFSQMHISGFQWYWRYSYIFVDFITNKSITLSYDSFPIADEDLNLGEFRLLSVDNQLLLPEREVVRLSITSSDVIHSFAVPSLGVKMDAIPGRLNAVYVFIIREQTFYGQCSELCGVNHGNMPIVVRSIKKFDFYVWLMEALVRTSL